MQEYKLFRIGKKKKILLSKFIATDFGDAAKQSFYYLETGLIEDLDLHDWAKSKKDLILQDESGANKKISELFKN